MNDLYIRKQMSAAQIAIKLKYSISGINYWLKKFNIQKRPISEAIYLKHNPDGDPFTFNTPKNIKDAKLFGLGIGLYWGEGTKANKNAVRLGNSDPELMKVFMEFLHSMCGVNKEDLKFELQVFEDLDKNLVEKFWIDKLDINRNQMYKTRAIPKRGKGTYNRKVKYGVMTVYYGNTKLRNELVKLLPV